MKNGTSKFPFDKHFITTHSFHDKIVNFSQKMFNNHIIHNLFVLFPHISYHYHWSRFLLVLLNRF